MLVMTRVELVEEMHIIIEKCCAYTCMQPVGGIRSKPDIYESPIEPYIKYLSSSGTWVAQKSRRSCVSRAKDAFDHHTKGVRKGGK